MFVKKIKFFDNNVDDLKENLGKNLIEVNGKLVESTEQNPVKMSFDNPNYQTDFNNLLQMTQTFSFTLSKQDEEEFEPSASPRAYHYANIVAPESRNVIAVNDDSKAVSSAQVTAKFNFVSEQYETFTDSITEPELPCIYLESDPLQTETIQDLKFFPRTVPKARYFYDFNYILKNKYVRPNAEQFKNLLFGQNFSFNIANAEKEQYPFFNNIRFNYNTTNDFKNVLKQFGFFEQFIDDYINGSKGSTTFRVQTTEDGGSRLEQQDLSLFDIPSWLQMSDFSMDTTNKVVFEPRLVKKNKYNYFIDKMAFFGKMRKFCKSKMPTAEDIINNKPVETETLFYRIDKFVEGSSTPSQSFWIPADDNIINYIDTQVKYGILYRYTISAYVVAFGCSYSYANKRIKSKKMSIDMTVTPSFQVIEIPNIYSDVCRIIQPPQPVPTVLFANEKNAKDYLKIYLNLTLNSNNDPLRVINPSEGIQESLRQEYDRLGERPRFVYNNERALYEIYRTDFIPKSFGDIADYRIASIRNGFPSTGVSHKDYVTPFKKYYYVFRSVNFHGLVSNPSPIYEVELTKDADETFLSSKTVGFFEENVNQVTRKFIKLMQAIPASQHTVFEDNLNNVQTEDGQPVETFRGTAIDKITLGVAEHPIWGKKFKFRITSTTTGKKLDINVMVNLIKKKTLENSK